MAKYALLMELKTNSDKDVWWMNHTDGATLLQVFDSFEEAKAEMRKTVTQVIKKCDFFPLKDGQYEPTEDWSKYTSDYQDIQKLGDIICKTINNPDYFCKDTDFDIMSMDHADWCFAFVGNKDFILVDYYGKRLNMNIHNMTDNIKPYYLSYVETNVDGKVVYSILISLLNDAKKDDKAR